MTTITGPSTVTSKMLEYIKAHPKVDTGTVAEAIGGKPSSVASLAVQMTQTGKLIRIRNEAATPRKVGQKGAPPTYLYMIGDPTAPNTLRKGQEPLIAGRVVVKRAPRKTKLAQAIADELEAHDVLAKAKAVVDEGKRNGHPVIPEFVPPKEDPMGEQAQIEWEQRKSDREQLAQIDRELAEEDKIFREQSEAADQVIGDPDTAPPSTIPPIPPEVLREKMEAPVAHAPPEELPPPPPPPAPQPAPIREPQPIEDIALAASYAPSGIASVLPLHQLMDSIAKIMAGEIMHRLSVEMTGLAANMVERLKAGAESAAPTPEELAARIANAAAPVKKRLPAVLIVGLRPTQAGQISMEFNDVFDLRFWSEGEAPELLKHNCKNAEHVYVVTSRISHGTRYQLNSLKVPFFEASRGMTQLRSELTDLFVKAEDERRQ